MCGCVLNFRVRVLVVVMWRGLVVIRLGLIVVWLELVVVVRCRCWGPDGLDFHRVVVRRWG